MSIKTDCSKEDHGVEDENIEVPEAEESLITESHDEPKDAPTLIKEVPHGNRKRGRPRKESTKKDNSMVEKRGRGRPRKEKTPMIVETVSTRKGRPSKKTSETNETTVPVKRGRGCPRKNPA